MLVSRNLNTSRLLTSILLKLVVGCALFWWIYIQRFQHGTSIPSRAGLSTSPPIVPTSRPDEGKSQPTREQLKAALRSSILAAKSAKKRSRPDLSEALVDPQSYQAIKAIFVHRLESPYHKLYEQIGGTSNERSKLKELLAEKELVTLEAYSISTRENQTVTRQMVESLRSEIDPEIKQLLGDDGFAYYKSYEKTLPFRMHVDTIERRLSFLSTPLTTDQYDNLVAALSESHSDSIHNTATPWLATQGIATSEETLSIAKRILTPTQFQVYKNEYDAQLLSSRVEAKYKGVVREARRKPST